VLFADFPDAAADRTAAEAFEIVSPTTEEFFAAVSYGRMGMSLHPHLEWLRMGGGSERHFAAIRSFEGQRDFIQSAVRLADPRFDFSGMDAVVVITAPNASLIRYGPAWLGFEAAGGRIEADGHTMTNGATSGADLTMWGWAWLAHEIGHTLGLPDLYDREGGGFTRPFGVMDHIAGSAPEFFAYERWHVGWIDSDQIACVESEATVTLSAVERPGGTKAAMVPLDRGRAVVVESRRAVGFDERLSREGALVYTVDTSIETFEGPIRVKHPRRALLEGESITLEGVAVRVLEATADGDTVLVSVEPGG
jgi:M6 family metalloprotease-like protein